MGEMLLNGREPADWELPAMERARAHQLERDTEQLAGLIASEKDLPHNPGSASWLTDIATDML